MTRISFQQAIIAFDGRKKGRNELPDQFNLKEVKMPKGFVVLPRFAGRLLAAGLVAAIFAPAAAKADFIDTFSNPTLNPSWVSDRYPAPQGTNAAAQTIATIVTDPTNAANMVLQLSMTTANDAANRPAAFSSTFYNTQGITAQGINVTAPWTLSADLYVNSDMLSTTGQMERTDLWGRDSNPDENSAYYPIIGMTNASPTDPFNQSAADRTARWRVWDSNTANGWVDLTDATPTLGWHDLSILFNGTSFIYSVDGSQVYTETPASAADVGTLANVYLEGYNFGSGNYNVLWDNVNAASQVPEPASGALMAFGAFFLLRRRRAA
jgi:hypothetical protein